MPYRFRVEEVFPGLRDQWNGRATQSLWHKHPHALNSCPYYRPGQYAAFSGSEELPQGGVFFAGDATTVEFQGYMEAARSPACAPPTR